MDLNEQVSGSLANHLPSTGSIATINDNITTGGNEAPPTPLAAKEEDEEVRNLRYKLNAFKQWNHKATKSEQEEVIRCLLVEVHNLQKRVTDIEKNKILSELNLPYDLAKSLGVNIKPPRRLKSGMGTRPLMESEILESYEHSFTAKGAAEYLGVSYSTLRTNARRLGIWKTNRRSGAIKKPWNPELGKYPLSEILQNKHQNINPYYLRNKLFQSGSKDQKCDNCGFSERRITDGQQPLLVNFIDGNNNNYALENIQILCYNCMFMVGRGYISAHARMNLPKVKKHKTLAEL
jgi:hypothetical protein